jgi:intracellular sulfur oxidation DsrE/DsrF family protein
MIGDSTHRRGFLGRAAAGIVGALSVPRLLEAGTEVQGSDPDAWLAKLTAPHRCLFDAPKHGDGLPQIHVFNYINTYQKAYNVPATAVNTIFTAYGPPGAPSSMGLAWNDAMWAKYKVGEHIGLKNSAGAFITNNVFNQPKAGDPVLFNGSITVASLEALQKLGTTIIMCNNAFMAWVGYLAGKGLGTAGDIEKDIRANLLPGVVTVPAMVIAIEKAQGKGIAYNKQG